MENVLVIGAAPGSLGHAVALAAKDRMGVSYPPIPRSPLYKVITAGLGHPTEDLFVDALNEQMVGDLMESEQWDHVVCTVGINLDGSHPEVLADQLRTNVVAHANVIQAWTRCGHLRQGNAKHFVSISSNSAHRPRSRSAGYCASKAALSMYVRSVAREWAETNLVFSVVESGWIAGTPMSHTVADRLGMEVFAGIDCMWLGNRIVDSFKFGKAWNGTALRIDNGEV